MLAQLVEIVGASNVLVDPEVVSGYEVDWTRRFRGLSLCVVRPVDTEQVAQVLKVCADFAWPVQIQGGNTGLVGASVPQAAESRATGAVVVSTQKLRSLGEVDLATMQITVGAGVTLSQLREVAHRHAMEFPVDFGARDSATIGGMIATNAGGMQVIRHGMMRNQLRGLTAVLADGTVISHQSGLLKDNTGYDLAGLICGSEGTLAVITEARLALIPERAHRATMAVSLRRLGDAVMVVNQLRSACGHVESAEVFRQEGARFTASHIGVSLPSSLTGPYGLLVEFAGNSNLLDEVLEAIGSVSIDLFEHEPEIADSRASARRLWEIRDRHTEAIATLGPPVKLDVSIPLGLLDQFVEGLDESIVRVVETARTFVFGHVGDGNLHVNVSGVLEHSHAIEDLVLRRAVSFGGSISAEHGIGRAKKEWLPLCRSAAELATMRAIKRAFDPNLRLGRGILFEESDLC